MVRAAVLEKAVWEEVCQILVDPQRLEEEYQRRLDTPEAERENLELVESQLARIRRSIARLIDAYTDGLIEKAEFEPRLGRLRQRITPFETNAYQHQSVDV